MTVQGLGHLQQPVLLHKCLLEQKIKQFNLHFELDVFRNLINVEMVTFNCRPNMESTK